jgi:hypothetical protein
VATNGENPWPPAGRFSGRLRGGSHGHRQDTIKQRQRWRDEINTNVSFRKKGAPGAIVIRLNRERQYPYRNSSLILGGASPWLKVELKAVNDRHLETYASIQDVTMRRMRRGTLIARPIRSGEQEDQTVYVVGRIRLEKVAEIDWEPDQYYGLPKIYVRYGRRGPYAETVLCEVGANYPYELTGVRYKPRRYRLRSRLRDAREMRRAAKAADV